jgi:plasmid stabilization system protein ParE
MLAKAIANSLSKEILRNSKDLETTLLALAEMRSPEAAADCYRRWRGEVRGLSAIPEAAESEGQVRQVETFLRSRGIEEGADYTAELARVRTVLAADPKAFFMSIKGPELLNKWVGETEHSIRRLFIQAKRKASPATPVIMFFDEIEALFRRRGSRSTSDMESTVVPQFLSEIDGVEELRDVIIIGATNRQDLLDAAILRPGRLDTKIKVERPTREGAVSIFRKYLTEDLPISGDGALDKDSRIAEMVRMATEALYSGRSLIRATGKRIEGGEKRIPCSQVMSGAMIENIVARAKKRAVRREIENGPAGISWNDLQEAIREELLQNKDQLAAQELLISEEEFVAEVRLADADEPGSENLRWFQPPARPWAA